MDVTAFLLAADLELLDVVEKAFAPIFVSPHLLDSLRQQIEQATPGQPSREIVRQKVLAAVENERLRVFGDTESSDDLKARYATELGDHWCGALTRVQQASGLLCDFMPPLGVSGRPVFLAPEDVRFVASCADIIAALHRAGAISPEEREEMLPHLGDGRVPFQPDLVLRPGTTLVLDTGIAEILADAGALDCVLNFFSRVEISEREAASLRQECRGHAQQLSLVEWLKGLAERLHRGILRELYRPIARGDATQAGEPPAESPDEQCLRDLLKAKESGAKKVWCDDRQLSRYEMVDGLPNYGISEVLRALRSAGRISASAYFDALLKLRAANARYLPIEADELKHHLLRAPIGEDGMPETPSLVLLRRYAAACALDRFRLHPPAKDEKGTPVLAEFMWAVETQRAVARALVGLWEGKSMNERDRQIRAEWILNQILTHMPGFAEAHSGLPQPNAREGLTAEIGLLFSLGFMLESPWKRTLTDDSHARARFYRWLGDRLVEPLSRVDPVVVQDLAALLTGDFLKRAKRAKKAEARALRSIIIRWLLDMPDVVKNAMKLDAATCRWLGIKRDSWTVGTFGRRFAGDGFWRAVAEAANRGQAVLRADDDAEFLVRAAEPGGSPYRLPVSGPGLPAKACMVEPLVFALSGTESKQRAFLESRKDWFDCGAEEKRAVVQKILRTDDAARRVELLDEARENSTEHFYRCLLRKLRRHEPVTTQESVPPSAASLCRHLRMREESDFASRASRLIREIGLAWTIERFATLPITLPEPILRAVTGSSAVERSGLFARLRRRLHSPLARLHLAHLLACAASHEARYLDEAKVEIASLFDHTEEHRRWKTFRAILEWTRRSFQTYHDFRQLDAATKLTLVWLHAGRLQNTLECANARDVAIDRAFLTAGEAFGIVSDSHDFPFWHDAAHPRCAGRLPVLLCGLGAAFRTLPLDLAAELRTQVAPWSNAGEAVTASAFLLLRDTMLGRNSLNSFLGGDTFVLLRSAVAEDTLATMLPHPPQDVLRSTLTELATSPNNTHLWQLLAATAADYPLPEDLEPILERLLLETDFLKLLHVDTAAEHFILQFIAARQAVTQSSVSSDRIEQATFSFAQRYAKEPMSEEDVRRRVGMLAGCLLCLAVIPSDEAASHGRFHKFLVRLLHEWPKAAPVLRSRFDGWPTRLPPSRQNGVWELEMTLRAIR